MGARKHSEIEIAAEDRQESVALFDWERLPHALSQLKPSKVGTPAGE
jgi:hypothetical protein